MAAVRLCASAGHGPKAKGRFNFRSAGGLALLGCSAVRLHRHPQLPFARTAKDRRFGACCAVPCKSVSQLGQHAGCHDSEKCRWLSAADHTIGMQAAMLLYGQTAGCRTCTVSMSHSQQWRPCLQIVLARRASQLSHQEERTLHRTGQQMHLTRARCAASHRISKPNSRPYRWSPSWSRST
jgi:hypothetical protein